MSIPPRPAVRPNWVHLDLKGACPSLSQVKQWLAWLSGCGFNGVVFEYEDRLPWQTWEPIHRPGFTLDGFSDLLDCCNGLGLKVVPLIQIQGHLEWLLKHDAYAHWREADHINELCPQLDEVQPRLRSWIDEVVRLHPGLDMIHLGADETWHLATCPRCQDVAGRRDEGKMAIYLDHVIDICRYVLDKGVRPMIWADMFWREDCFELAARFPDGTILIDWQYSGAGPWETTQKFAACEREVWGASAIRCSHDTTQANAPLADRLENVIGWNRVADAGAVSGVIHTTWGRARSLLPLYGPWEGWLPSFIAAGNASAWSDSEPLGAAVALIDQALTCSAPKRVKQIQEELDAVNAQDPWHAAALDWYRLVLRHRMIFLSTISGTLSYNHYAAVGEHVGADLEFMNQRREHRQEVLRLIAEWESDARRWWSDRQWSDVDEYMGSRAGNLSRALTVDDWMSADIASERGVTV